ncbi:cell division protein FtsL [Enterococcus faecalis]|uniref:cell division protein FtsL n=1 Tax=Enterococcus faecalis TaxID=1351 RepID=UPI00080C7634|nr:cell division protein FtsL [Enterococcus faecalis]ANU72430.1 cell division protein FtsL [Enterococcus faecalis]ASU27136.1 cell division protein FtsL [Enterococcus faecalis]MCO8258662.1 cell division protein FtsL [Enterococcus faecalis]MCP8906811.1 cell division protein FtsL [Enterococcus faecalis]MCP8909769.1 cell division protein FtsL [Enterococcus faecalis]
MAELKKVNDFHYEAPEMDQPTVATEQDRKMQEETTLLPKKKLKNVSLLEKLIGVVLVCATIGIAIATIQVRTTIVQTMNDITETQAVIKEKEDNALKLEQERSELSKSDRIKDVAKKQGLENNGDNVRTVK